MMMLLAVLLAWGVLAPASLPGSSGGLLLIGGALIGMPHGSSDFVVAHQFLGPRLRGWWFPAFLAGYLLVTAGMLIGWHLVPVGTFALFLFISGLHFGAGEDGVTRSCGATIRWFTRAATPIAPIFLGHPAAVAGIVGLMTGQPAAAVVSTLEQCRIPGLALSATLLACTVAGAVAKRQRARSTVRSREAVELILLSIAAILLPPLLAFAMYFCLLHAVRHMASLGQRAFPKDGHAALKLVTAIVLPSALVCSLVLGLAWDAVAGVLSTEHLLAWALQVTASLTVPHVMLEWCVGRAAVKAGVATPNPSGSIWSFAQTAAKQS